MIGRGLLAVLLLVLLVPPPAAAARSVHWHRLAVLSSADWPRGVSGVQNVGRYVNRAGEERWVVVRYRGGDAVLHRHDSAGRLLSTMTLKGAGHASQTGMRISGRKLQVLIRWGSRLYWVAWRDGVVHRGDPGAHRLRIGPKGSHAALSGNRHWLITRRQAGGSREQYVLYTYPGLHKVASCSRRKPGVHQGFAVSSRWIYVMYGRTGGRAWIDRLDPRTCRRTGRLNVTRFHLRRLAGREPEGLTWRYGRLVMSVREGGLNRRRIVSVGELVVRW